MFNFFKKKTQPVEETKNNFETWVSTLMFFLYASFYFIYAYGFKNLKSKLAN